MFRHDSVEDYPEQRKRCQINLRHLDSLSFDLRQRWQCFVRMEIFDRLELTHTCIEHLPTVRSFPEEDRLEIEAEEEELNLELDVLMNEYDDWQHYFDGDVLDCVDTFFDKLDQSLQPRGGFFLWQEVNYGADILGVGTTIKYWRNSRGKLRQRDHKEGVQETYILQSLFDESV